MGTTGERKARRDRFFEVFRAHVDCIAAMQVPDVSAGKVRFEDLRALLICTHLDTLAKAHYGGKTGSRFRRLLEEGAGQDATYRLVALERLSGSLRRMNADPRAIEVVDTLVRSRWGSHSVAAIPDGIDVDLTHDDVADRLRAAGLPLESNSAWGKPLVEALEAARYSTIVWRDYRCGLVHETQVVNAGFNHDESADRVPFYFQVVDDTSGLVIPTRFLLRTLCGALAQYRRHCDTNNLDPYKNL